MNDITILTIRQGTNGRFTAHTPDGERIRLAMTRTPDEAARCLHYMSRDGRFGLYVNAVATDVNGREIRTYNLLANGR